MIQQIASFINNGAVRLVGITGRAGSGKSTLATELKLPTYHIDSSFIGDSAFRKDLMEKKGIKSPESLQDMTNQYNWWNWDEAELEITSLKKSGKLALVEGAILGPPAIVNMLGAILFITIPKGDREARIYARDKWKRSDIEIRKRLELTDKYESNYYAWLLQYYESKIFPIDKEYNFI